MMLERFDTEARTVIAQAAEHARRLGHRHIGGEHLLLAVVSSGAPASAVMRAQGVTPELVEEEIVRRVGLGAGGGLFAGLDRDALATIGIDLDAVRARIEASFGPQALTSAAQAAHQGRPGPRAPARPGACAAGAAGAGPGGSWSARPGSARGGMPRPLLCSRAAAKRAYPVHPGLEEDPRAHPAGGRRHG